MNEPEPARRFAARWWHWLLASAVVLALTPLAIAVAARARGFHRLDAELARLRARGVATTIADLIADAPPVDAARQASWDAAMNRLHAARVDDVALDDAAFADIAAGAPYPAEVLKRFDAAAPAMADVRSALRDGPVVATGFAHMRERLGGSDHDIVACAALPVANLLSIRVAAQWLELDALRGEDPEGALSDLDRLRAALARPALAMDAMVRITVDEVRDLAYLRCLALRRITAERIAAWRAEPPTQLLVIADGLQGERILYSQTVVDFERQRRASLSTGDRLSLGSVSLATRFDWYVNSGDGGATVVAYDAAMVDRWRGARPDTPTDPGRSRGIVALAEANAIEIGITGWEACARHRIARITAALLTSGDLPENAAAFIRRFPAAAGHGDDAALRYESLGASRFRLSLDPATPVPDFVDAKRPAAKAKTGAAATLVGKPPRAAPLVHAHDWIEADAASRPPR